MSVLETAFVKGQYLLPHHALSRALGKLTHCQQPWLKNSLIQGFSRAYDINLGEAISSDPRDYSCFNAFFTRALQPGTRPIASAASAIASPADGSLSQRGSVDNGQLIQAKGRKFGVNALLGGEDARAMPFMNGHFFTIYLSPRDYHRLHMPLTGTLREMTMIPGRLFSVNGATTRGVPDLFARNERVVAVFDTDFGAMALVLVGAIFVASIETIWHGVVTPPHRAGIETYRYPETPIRLEKGAEMGRFNMGSTIIALFEAPLPEGEDVPPLGSPVRVGQALGKMRDRP